MKTIIVHLLKNWQWYVIGILALVLSYTCERADKMETKADRQTENIRQIRMEDSLKFSQQYLTADELKQYLEYNNKDLMKKLSSDHIRTSRVEKIINNNHVYRDTILNEINLDSVLAGVYKRMPKEQDVIDTTKCMTIKGKVSFDGSRLSLKITDREYKNKSDAVVYWERKPWKFLGMTFRFLGKKQFTAKTYDECGISKTTEITKVKE